MSEAQDAVGTEPAPVLAVKFADGTDNIIQGLALPFGKDTDGEDFGPDTDFALDWFPDEGRPFLYHHGLDETVKSAVVGRQIERWTDDLGHWVKIQLDKRSKYMDAIKQLVEAGALGLSSGAMPHLVRTTKSGHIERWPWVEISGTPSPSHPGAALYAVKTADAIEHIAAVKSALPEPLREAIDESLDASLAGLPYAEHADRVLVDMKALVERTQEIAGLRAKAKRTIRSATRDRLTAVRDQAQQVIEDIDALLVDPDAEARKAVDIESIRYERERARMLGVPI